MYGEARFVDLGPGLNVVDHAREHAVGVFADFDGGLACAGAVHGEEANAEGKDRAETFGEIFFAAVETVDGDDQRHWARGVFR